MKQFLWIAGVMICGLSQSVAAPKSYGLATVGYNDVDYAEASDKKVTYSLAFGKQIHRQWYAEVGYLNLFDYSNKQVDANGDSLYLAMLGKASSGTGELFYKLGVARVDIDVSSQCATEGVTSECDQSEALAAGLVGLGFDYYVGLRSMIRIEYLHMTGEDSFSTNMVNVGFRYNFN